MALLVSFENRIDEMINKQVMCLQQLLLKQPFTGLIELVPAYASLAIFFDVGVVRKNYTKYHSAFEFVREYSKRLIDVMDINMTDRQNRTIVVPVLYNGEDLHFVAKQHHLPTDEIIRIHTSKVYRVFMTGFLPGFAYMGKLDERIATARLAVPRTRVSAGAVGIAGFQTGIYPIASPGGWQLIGQTPVKIFDARKENPCLLKAGDRVQFEQITKHEFEKLNEY